MSSINQLSEASTASAAMQVPVYDPNNGQPRKLPLSAILAYIQGGLTSDASQPFRLIQKTVAQLASDYPAASWAGGVVYCTNGNAGSPCLAVSNGTAWLRVALGAAVSAT
ncbi:MAG TPA: hypothetical protein VF522_19095 [Ramlibacter sp.]|uniref:hypothetical protein n=1 Tax=Ramlibacter sp. TaxID=1917967 RepID=UPI002ECFBC29